MPDGLSSEIFLFADDTKIFKEIKQKRDCDLLQNDLDFMQLWTDIWLLRFHPQKCHAMTIGVRKTNLVEYSLPDGEGGRIALNQVNSEKNTGVMIDSNLTFREHMTEKVNKAN